MNFAMPVMEPCYFCEIARGMDAWNVIDRDDSTITVLNGRQYEAGQCMVFPLRHAPTLLDLDDLEAAGIMKAARYIGSVITQVFQPQALLLYQNNGILSGQEVPHFHLHVVPRSEGSDWTTGPAPLARAQAGGKAAHLDHTRVTDEKLARVSRLAAGIRSGRG